MIVHPLPRTIVHLILEQRMPKELDEVARLRPAGEPSAPPDQLRFLQLAKVLLRLALPNADLLGQSVDGRKTLAVLAGVPCQPPVSHLGAGRHQIGANQGLWDENTGEKLEGIEWVADLERISPLPVLRLGHDFLWVIEAKKLIRRWLLRKRLGCSARSHRHFVYPFKSAVGNW
jgi:hypothetical protein